jgi:hypothetical protein
MRKPSPAGCGQKTEPFRLTDLLPAVPGHPAKLTATMKRRALKKKPCKLHPTPHA